MDDTEAKEANKSILKQDRERPRLLAKLLDDQQDKQNHLLALKVNMGNVNSYLTSVTLGWVAGNVRFVASMPIYEGNIDEDAHRIEYNENTYQYIMQRNPNWTRQIDITKYLAKQKHHKFPPLLIVGYQEWVNDSKSDRWQQGKAMSDSLNVMPLDNKGAYYDMDTAGTQFYALDGQHRLMAIVGLKELLATKQLYKRDADGKPTNKSLNLDDIIDDIISQEDEENNREQVAARLQSLLSEQIGIEIIPAIVPNETWKNAVRRLRASFVDVNRNAKLPTRGENYILEDKNGFCIVAVHLMVYHKLLKGRTKVKTGTLSDREVDYTTLITLVEISKKYLSQQNGFSRWDSRKTRPGKDELQKGIDTLKKYFDMLADLPAHKELIIKGTPANKIRKADDGSEYQNVLFRPIAQIALADAVGKLVKEENNEDASIKGIKKALSDAEKSGMLKLTPKTSPWFGVLSNTMNKNMRKQNAGRKNLCRDLFHYLLGGKLQKEVRDELREKFAEERKISEDEGYNLQGNKVAPDQIELPAPWRYPRR